MGGGALPPILSSYYHKPHFSAFISSEARAPYVSLLLSQRQVRHWHHQRYCVLYKTGSRVFFYWKLLPGKEQHPHKNRAAWDKSEMGFLMLGVVSLPHVPAHSVSLLHSDGWRERRSIRKGEKRHGIKLRERRWRLTLRKRIGPHLGRAILHY